MRPVFRFPVVYFGKLHPSHLILQAVGGGSNESLSFEIGKLCPVDFLGCNSPYKLITQEILLVTARP